MRWRLRLLAAAALVLFSLISGCARRAYTDVYVDTMASEIRDLEDQLYEYDNEYRVLEQELESLKLENARLRGGTQAGSSNSSVGGRTGIRLGSPQELQSQPSRLGSDARIDNFPSGEDAVFVPSPAPLLDQSAKPVVPKSSVGGPPTPSTSPPTSPSNSAPAAGTGAVELPSPKDLPGTKSQTPFDLKNLTPPNVEHGEPMPPSMNPPKLDPTLPRSASTQNELEIQVGQIPLPARLASTPADAMQSGSHDHSGGPARLLPAMEMPKDTRIVDVKFHPGLSRAMNFDAQGDDDGLYLVLQPMNASGQFVPIAADLVIAVIDPSRNDNTGRIGKWSYSTAEVKNKLQPIGNSQGIHLSLPWNGPDPGADRVIVFAYYTLEDGRRIVSETEIFVNNAHRQNTVWVPRSKPNPSDGIPGMLPGTEVRTASGLREAR